VDNTQHTVAAVSANIDDRTMHVSIPNSCSMECTNI